MRHRLLPLALLLAAVGLAALVGGAAADDTEGSPHPAPADPARGDGAPRPSPGAGGGDPPAAGAAKGVATAKGGDDEDAELMARLEAFRAKKRKVVKQPPEAGGGAGGGGRQGEAPPPDQPGAPPAPPAGEGAKEAEALDELELERLAFEAAERAVRAEEARKAAEEFAKREAQAAERLAQKQAEEARAEAARAFNVQDMNRRGAGQGNHGHTMRAAQYAQECPECPTVVVGARGRTARAVIERLLFLGEPVIVLAREERPGVMQVPPWFAEIMVKARYRGLRAEWMQGDATRPETLRKAFAGAKAVVFCATAKKGGLVGEAVDALRRRDSADMPKAVDGRGLVNVAQEAVAAKVSRLIIVSAAGVARPFRWSSLLKQPLGPIISGRLGWKRQGELGAIEACLRSNLTSYTVVRAAEMGDSAWQQSFLVTASSVSLHQGDYIEGNVSRAAVAATAVEAIFAPGAHNVVLEVQSSSQEQREGWAKGIDGWELRKEAEAGEQQQSDRELEQLRWQRQFRGLSPGRGEYLSLEDQTRAAVQADMEVWIRAAEARKKHEQAPKLAPKEEPRPDTVVAS